MRDPKEPNDVIVIHRFPSAEHAERFVNSAEVQAAMAGSGVAGLPRFDIGVEVTDAG